MQAAELAPMHVVDWGEAQEVDAALAACQKWLRAHRDTPPQKRDALLKKYLQTWKRGMLSSTCATAWS